MRTEKEIREMIKTCKAYQKTLNYPPQINWYGHLIDGMEYALGDIDEMGSVHFCDVYLPKHKSQSSTDTPFLQVGEDANEL